MTAAFPLGAAPEAFEPAPVDAGLTTEVIDQPILEPEVREIASRGYPLAESVPVMQLRNRRITAAYGDLSKQLATLLARGADPANPRPTPADLDANWCTFAAWSSRTIGESISKNPTPGDLAHLTGPFAPLLKWIAKVLLTRDGGAIYRSLAAGNRFVFLEIGVAVARFVEAFEAPASGSTQADPPPERDQQWQRYWDGMAGVLDELGQLDPSWVSTNPPDRSNLELGFRLYFDALHERDRKARAQLILAGNLAVSAYEQTRVDGYLAVSLSALPERALLHLVRRRTGTFRNGFRRWLSTMWGWSLTKTLMQLETSDEVLYVGHPVPPLPGAASFFPKDVTDVSNPISQALLTMYDRSNGNREKTAASNWVVFDQRMNYITNLMRSRQQHLDLFRAPFELAVMAKLFAGELVDVEQVGPPLRADLTWG